MSIEVRRAIVADAAEIARVHVASWRETYAHLVPADQLDDLTTPSRLERRTQGWTSIIEADDDVWVAQVDASLVGFAGSASRSDPASVRPLELQSIYVLADHHGSGAGQALLDAAIGDSPAFLFVAADNPRATRFYRRNGFAFDGVEEQHTLVRTPVRALRMVR